MAAAAVPTCQRLASFSAGSALRGALPTRSAPPPWSDRLGASRRCAQRLNGRYTSQRWTAGQLMVYYITGPTQNQVGPSGGSRTAALEPTPFRWARAPISAAPQVGVTSRCSGLFAARPVRHPVPPPPQAESCRRGQPQPERRLSPPARGVGVVCHAALSPSIGRFRRHRAPFLAVTPR